MPVDRRPWKVAVRPRLRRCWLMTFSKCAERNSTGSTESMGIEVSLHLWLHPRDEQRNHACCSYQKRQECTDDGDRSHYPSPTFARHARGHAIKRRADERKHHHSDGIGALFLDQGRVLRWIVFHQQPLNDAKLWIDHMANLEHAISSHRHPDYDEEPAPAPIETQHGGLADRQS